MREGPGGTDDLVGADQKIPDWLIKITFLVKVETAVRLVLNLGLVLWALAQVTPFLGLWFFLFSKHICSCDRAGWLGHLVAQFIITLV